MMMIPFPTTSRSGYVTKLTELLIEANYFMQIHWTREPCSESEDEELKIMRTIGVSR